MAKSTRNSKSFRNFSTYWERTHWPLQSLYFLLPLLLLYELGTLAFAPAGTDRLPPIRAEWMLDRFFNLFGVTSFYLPGLVVVVVLLSWHFVRRDPWRPELRLYGLMWLESLALAAPLFVFGTMLVRGAPQMDVLAALPTLNDNGLMADWKANLVLSIGAGIYEELVFRLIAIAALHLLLVDVLELPQQYGAVGAVSISAVAFAMYHFNTQPFDWGLFAYYTAAGLYLAAVYVLRGFGIVAAVHALYDVLVVAAMGLGE